MPDLPSPANPLELWERFCSRNVLRALGFRLPSSPRCRLSSPSFFVVLAPPYRQRKPLALFGPYSPQAGYPLFLVSLFYALLRRVQSPLSEDLWILRISFPFSDYGFGSPFAVLAIGHGKVSFIRFHLLSGVLSPCTPLTRDYTGISDLSSREVTFPVTATLLGVFPVFFPITFSIPLFF